MVVGYSDRRGAGRAPAWWGIGREAAGLRLSFCAECGRYAVWRETELLWPQLPERPAALRAMPATVRADFDEARAVFDAPRVPRPRCCAWRCAACAASWACPAGASTPTLRRCCVPACPSRSRRACARRAAGADAVPPGVLDERDGREVALVLFTALNRIVDRLIVRASVWQPR